jgi:WD40 repeat protein
MAFVNPARAEFARWAPIWAGWLLMLAGIGALAWFIIATPAERETLSTEPTPPFAQVNRMDNESPVWSVSFSPQDPRLAWATIAGEVWLKDLKTGIALRLQQGPMSSARSLAFSPDGRVLAVAGFGSGVRIWDSKLGTELSRLGNGLESGRCVAFSPSGKLLAVGESWDSRRRGALTIWDWESRRLLMTLHGHSGVIQAVAFAPDGARLVSSDSAGIVKLWDVSPGQERASFRACEPGVSVAALAMSPDDQLIVTAGYMDRAIRFWDAASGEPRGELPKTSSAVTDLAFSPDAKTLAVVNWDGTIALWEVNPKRERAVLRTSGRGLRAVAFSTDGGLLATGGMDGAVRLWDMAQALGSRTSVKDRTQDN